MSFEFCYTELWELWVGVMNSFAIEKFNIITHSICLYKIVLKFSNIKPFYLITLGKITSLGIAKLYLPLHNGIDCII